MLKIIDSKKYMKEIQQLYDTAFPEEERYLDFKSTVKQMEGSRAGLKYGELVAFGDGEEDMTFFVGFVMVLFCGDIVHLYYFAIDEKLRGRRYGEQALNLIKARYENKNIWLSVERPDEMAENQQQRLMRKKFYYRNGFQDTGINVEKNGCQLEMMSADGTIDFNTLRQLGELVDEMVINGKNGDAAE